MDGGNQNGDNYINAGFYAISDYNQGDEISEAVFAIKKSDTDGFDEQPRYFNTHGIPNFLDFGWFEAQLEYDLDNQTFKFRIQDVKEDGTGYEGPQFEQDWTENFTPTWDVERIGIYFGRTGGNEELFAYLDNLGLGLVVPEPASFWLLVTGGLVLTTRRRRR